MIKLSPIGVYGNDVNLALALVWTSACRTPSENQSTLGSFWPLSNTDVNGLLADAETNGAPESCG